MTRSHDLFWASASFELSVAYGVQTQITAFKLDMQEVLTD